MNTHDYIEEHLGYAEEATKELFISPEKARKMWENNEHYNGNHFWVRDAIQGYCVIKIQPDERKPELEDNTVYAPCYLAISQLKESKERL